MVIEGFLDNKASHVINSNVYFNYIVANSVYHAAA